MLTWPIITLSWFFSLGNFRAFISFSEMLQLKMSAVETDLQSFVFKASELLCESVSPKFVSVSASRTFIWKLSQQKAFKRYVKFRNGLAFPYSEKWIPSCHESYFKISIVNVCKAGIFHILAWIRNLTFLFRNLFLPQIMDDKSFHLLHTYGIFLSFPTDLCIFWGVEVYWKCHYILYE